MIDSSLQTPSQVSRHCSRVELVCVGSSDLGRQAVSRRGIRGTIPSRAKASGADCQGFGLQQRDDSTIVTVIMIIIIVVIIIVIRIAIIIRIIVVAIPIRGIDPIQGNDVVRQDPVLTDPLC